MKELVQIQSKLVAKKGQTNKFGGYRYRSAEDILESVKPLLKEHNCILTLTDDLVMVGDRYYIKATATIRNEDGNEMFVSGFAREALQQKGMSEGQITGGSSSYARKYALNGLLAIAENDDLDSHSEETSSVINDNQRSELATMIQDSQTDLSKFNANFNINTLAELHISEFQKAKAMLQSKLNKMK